MLYEMKDLVDKQTLQNVGQYLRDIRESVGMSQTEAAERAGFSSGGYISVLENGHRDVSKKTLFKLSQAYSNVTLGQMIEGIDAILRGEAIPAVPEPKTSGGENIPPIGITSSPISDLDALLKLLDAALAFMQLDPTFQLPQYPAVTTREKARDIALYQENKGRILLRPDELERLMTNG